MNSNSHACTKLTIQVGQPPWLLFLFLTVLLFFVYHDLSFSRNGADNYNPSEDNLAVAVAEGSTTRRIALLSLGLFAIVTLVRHRADGRLRIQGSLGWFVLAFVSWAFVSLIWAEDRGLTFTRLTVFLIFCIAALAVACRFSLREIILWTFFTSVIFLIVGVTGELFFGRFRPFAPGYRFAGTLHPNHQGINCALLLLSGFAAAFTEKRRRILFRVCTLLGLVFLILTASRTAFAAALLALTVYLGAVIPKRMKLAMAYALSIILCILLLFLANGFLPNLKATIMLGRDDSTVGSFGGRTEVWNEIGYYIQQSPILGYGYGGFWTPSHISELSKEENWGIPNSHSAYLDYLLTLGAVGLVVYALLLFAGIRRAFQLQKLSRDSAYAFCGVLLVFCTMNGLLESAPTEPSSLMLLSMAVLARMAFVTHL
jgi:exopolysaccharide production protein ExoQ